MIRVLVADDHPTFREGLGLLLNAEPDISVIALVGTGTDAARLAAEQRPDVAVLDLRMPEGDGIAATRLIRRDLPDIRILVLTTYDTGPEIAAALAAGAHGYLLKTAEPPAIVSAVRAVAAGSAVLTDDVLSGLAANASRSGPMLFPELTTREASVLAALSQGLSPDEAAAALHLTPKTIRNYLAAVTAKLGVRDRTAAVILARSRGLGPEAPEPASRSRPRDSQ